MKDTSKKAPRRKYYRPSNDTKTFQINNKGHLQCLQDPKLIHKPNDKGKLPGSREAPIYHEPGTVSCKTMEDLKKLYPNSFDRLGSLKGAYNIRIDPSVKPATHARRKVPIESKEAIDRELDYLIEEEIITEQVEPTPWVSSVTFPRKPNGDVRVCLDPSNLNKAIIREHHKPMTVEEIAHKLAGATVYTKANALEAFLQCLCPVPHLAAHAQRAPVQVAPIAVLHGLRHHPRAAHSRLRMLRAQRQAVQPVHRGLHHPNCLRWSALSTACLWAQEIVKAIQ